MTTRPPPSKHADQPSAICEALGALGYQNAYHMTAVGPNGHHDKWVAALEAKFEQKGAEFGKKEFDELLAGFDVSLNPIAGDLLSTVSDVGKICRLCRISLAPSSTKNS